MKIHYLIKRILSFIIDLILFYGWGIIIYLSIGENKMPYGMTRITLSFIILTIVVIVLGTLHSIHGYSIGQKLLGLRNHYYRTKHGKFIPAIAKSIVLCGFIIPVIIPPPILLVNTIMFVMFSIHTYKKERRLFLDVLLGIDVIEFKNENEENA